MFIPSAPAPLVAPRNIAPSAATYKLSGCYGVTDAEMQNTIKKLSNPLAIRHAHIPKLFEELCEPTACSI